jgi:hypothetical protein
MGLRERSTAGSWRVEGNASASRTRGQAEGARSPHRAYTSSGGAAPVRSGVAGEVVLRRGASAARRDAAKGAAQDSRQATPIWLAALSATRCQASRSGEGHAISWNCISGRAVYTNAGADTETIQPLGVNLRGGQTLTVFWMPGETGYTMEVFGRHELTA